DQNDEEEPEHGSRRRGGHQAPIQVPRESSAENPGPNAATSPRSFVAGRWRSNKFFKTTKNDAEERFPTSARHSQLDAVSARSSSKTRSTSSRMRRPPGWRQKKYTSLERSPFEPRKL